MNARAVCLIGTLILIATAAEPAFGVCAQNTDELVLVGASGNDYVVVDGGRLVSVCPDGYCFVKAFSPSWAGQLVAVPSDASFTKKLHKAYDKVVAGNSFIKREPVSHLLRMYADDVLIADDAIRKTALKAMKDKTNVVSLAALRAVPNNFTHENCQYGRVIQVDAATGAVKSVTETER